MATAFIEEDSQSWKRVVLPSKKKKHIAFVEDMSTKVNSQETLDISGRSGPKVIGILSKMGHLSNNGPDRHAYTVMNLNEIGNVDVVNGCHDGTQSKTRTYVAKR